MGTTIEWEIPDQGQVIAMIVATTAVISNVLHVVFLVYAKFVLMFYAKLSNDLTTLFIV